ncbi:hypothetical protein [Roseateles koreensis]|uniref:DUF2917 domain-containing protein n=1 Tax=Roseateles koreensis TaxID=2987526 RepID=A0ABT5KUH6_9BURK|nr:hypothetical protein [Roseateles koreensis]MDC8786569.1 hypothetical protein [Roseateles koreensis]
MTSQSAHQASSTPRPLQPGAQQLLQVEAGEVLHVHSGALQLRLPLAMAPALCLSDTVWQLSHRLAAGAVWVAQAPTWIRLDGSCQTCLYTLRPASPAYLPNPAKALWQALVHRLSLRLRQKPKLTPARSEK